MAITQVPGRDSLEEHRSIVRLGVLHDACVLLGVEQLVVRQPAVAAGVIAGVSLQLDDLADYVLLARGGETGTGCEPVDLRVFVEMVEACVALASLSRRGWI